MFLQNVITRLQNKFVTKHYLMWQIKLRIDYSQILDNEKDSSVGTTMKMDGRNNKMNV